MQTTNATYEAIIANPNHWFETRINIETGGDIHYFDEDKLFSINVRQSLYQSSPTVGNAVAAEIEVKMLLPDVKIDRMAKIRPFIKAHANNTASSWVMQGAFFIDTREVTHNDDGLDILTIHGYDSMLKAEADYPSTSHNWPYSDINVVKEIAKTIGLQSSISATTGIDSRTITLMNKGYMIDLPVGYSMRETLGYIAAMYGGNWIITADNKLLLVPLGGIPAGTAYLVTNADEAITFGGVRILV